MGVWSTIYNNFSISLLFAVGIFIFFIISLFFTRRRKRKFIGLGHYTLDDVSSGKVFEDLKNQPSFVIGRKKKKKKRSRKPGTSNNKSEERCREIFESLFPGYKFKSVRPSFLKNPFSKRNLELDGYNPDIKTPLGRGLAFEYDGQQHSVYNPHFHRGGVEDFKYQVAKDSWKDKQCKAKGILLIRIPYYILYPDLERYIMMQLRKNKMLN